jgi:hypothetical protein
MPFLIVVSWRLDYMETKVTSITIYGLFHNLLGACLSQTIKKRLLFRYVTWNDAKQRELLIRDHNRLAKGPTSLLRRK